MRNLIQLILTLIKSRRVPEPSDLSTAPKTDKAAAIWHVPTSEKHFVTPSQPYLQEDWTLYERFGLHTGVDYGGLRQPGLPIFACADGEIVYSAPVSSPWGVFLGNHLALYVPSEDKSFLYCHLAEQSEVSGSVKAGQLIGVMGSTGKSAGGAIHLHLEGFHGRFDIRLRSFKSREDIKAKTFDADELIRSRLV